jgi:hypothetical protein
MQTFSFSLTNARLAHLLTITRNDGTVIRITNASRSITISSVTWTAVAAIELGDTTNTNDGTIPTYSYKVSAKRSGLFDPVDIDNGLFEDAAVLLEITNAANPTSKDFQFTGRMLGNADYDLPGNISFEVLSLFAIPRDIFIRQYGIPCDADFGDPRRCKIPTFPDLEVGSSDLHDVARLETVAVGDRRRFRFGSDDTPEDYANVYLECTAISTGITGASTPTPSSTVSSTYVDGGVTWTTRNAWLRYAQIDAILDSRNVTLTNYVEPRATDDAWLTPGRFAARSGYCKNMVAKIRTWSAAAIQVEMVQPFALLMAPGDWIEIAPDCDDTLDMCTTKYGNAYNYRGFPHLTGSKVVTSTIVPGVTTFPGPTDDPGGGGVGGYSAIAVEFAAGSS